MSSYAEVRKHIDAIGPRIVHSFLMRAAMGDEHAQEKLLPALMPKASRAQTPVSTRVEIDLASQSSARESLARIASKIGGQELGLDEGVTLLDAVGRALERISVVEVSDLTNRIEELERQQGAHGTVNTRVALSRANGSTPKWGNIQHHPSLTHEE